jgi:eukaryotic-like serine/threonine-protein kinase
VHTIFLQLVTPERTRAIKSVDELREITEQSQDIDALVQHLVDARLLVMQRSKQAGGVVEIVHESLLHTWPTLAQWLEENQDDAVFLDQLRVAARQWDGRGRPRDLLWRGETLNEARSWHRRYSGTLPSLQAAFLDAAFALARRGARRRRVAVVGSMVFLALLAAAATVAFIVIREAEVELRKKEKARLAMMGELEAKDMSKEQLAEVNAQLTITNKDLQRALDDIKQVRENPEDTDRALELAVRQASKKAEEAVKSRYEARLAEAQAAAVAAEKRRKDAEEFERIASEERARATKYAKDLQEQLAKAVERIKLLEEKVKKNRSSKNEETDDQ